MGTSVKSGAITKRGPASVRATWANVGACRGRRLAEAPRSPSRRPRVPSSGSSRMRPATPTPLRLRRRHEHLRPTTGEPCRCADTLWGRGRPTSASHRASRAPSTSQDGWTCMMPRVPARGGRRHASYRPRGRLPGPVFSAPDHVVEKSNGGPDTVENGRAAHFRCNIVGHGGAVG